MDQRNLINNEPGFEGEPKSNFEKLIIAEKIIKVMHFEAGVMESEAAELVHKCKALKARVAELTATSKDEKYAIKRDGAIIKIRAKIRKLELIIRDLRITNSELVSKMVKLQEDNIVEHEED